MEAYLLYPIRNDEVLLLIAPATGSSCRQEVSPASGIHAGSNSPPSGLTFAQVIGAQTKTASGSQGVQQTAATSEHPSLGQLGETAVKPNQKKTDPRKDETVAMASIFIGMNAANPALTAVIPFASLSSVPGQAGSAEKDDSAVPEVSNTQGAIGENETLSGSLLSSAISRYDGSSGKQEQQDDPLLAKKTQSPAPNTDPAIAGTVPPTRQDTAEVQPGEGCRLVAPGDNRPDQDPKATPQLDDSAVKAPSLPLATAMTGAIPAPETQIVSGLSGETVTAGEHSSISALEVPGVATVTVSGVSDTQGAATPATPKSPAAASGQGLTAGTNKKGSPVPPGRAPDSEERIGKASTSRSKAATYPVPSTQATSDDSPDDDQSTNIVAAVAPAHMRAEAPTLIAAAQSTIAASAIISSSPSPNQPQHDGTVPLTAKQPMNLEPAVQTPDPAAITPAIHSARVLERVGQSEIHIGVNSADFGPIEVHTTVSQDRVGASISSGHADLRMAMQAEMPSLHHAMENHQMHLDHFDVDTRSGGQGGNAPADREPRSARESSRGLRDTRMADTEEIKAARDLPPTIAPYSYGLSVIA